RTEQDQASASSDSVRQCSTSSVKPALSPDRSHPGPFKRPTSTSTAQIPSTTSAEACFSDATCTHCWTGGSSPSTPAPSQSRSRQSSSAIQGSPGLTAGLSSCPRTCGHDSSTYKSMRRSLTRPGNNWLDKIRRPHCQLGNSMALLACHLAIPQPAEISVV